VVLRRRGLTPAFVAPISVVLGTNAKRYFAGLVDFREGRIDDWLGVFADATRAASDAADRLWAEIEGLLETLIEQAGSPRADSVARKIVLGLSAQPVIGAETAATRYGVTPTAARVALNRLEEAGVLAPVRVGRRRDREWISDQLFSVLDAFEYDLAQSDSGSRASPSPTKGPRPRNPGRPHGSRRGRFS
jgi:hypothetical protein